MAGSGFQSDSAAMTRAVTGFEESAANVKKSMGDLDAELRGVLTRYSGAQAQAFWQLHHRLQEDMTLARRELETMSQLVHQSHRNYQTGDTTAATSLTGLSSQAGGAGGGVLGRLSGAN